MTLYTGTIILTELLMVAMSLHVLTYKGFTSEQKGWFLTTYFAIMICAGSEFLGLTLGGRGPEYALPLSITTVLEFSLAPMLPVFFTGALGMRSLAKKAFMAFMINVVIEIAAAPFGWIFYFDKTGTYYHGDMYIVYEFSYVFGMVFLIISLMAVGERFQRRDRITITMIVLMLAASVLPQVIFSVYTDYIGIAMSASLCYIYYNDLVQQDIQTELEDNQAKITWIANHIVIELANLIESRDIETGEHVARTSTYVELLAKAAREDGVYADVIDDDFVLAMRMLAPMHDIGKIVVSDQVLRKPGRLTAEEFRQMKEHAAAGGRITEQILEGVADEKHVRFARDIAMYHHEKWDGSGYPEGLKGEEIPLCARIMAVADVYDALISERCYKKAMKPEEAFEVIRKDAGTHFDPKLAETFLRHKDSFR